MTQLETLMLEALKQAFTYGDFPPNVYELIRYAIEQAEKKQQEGTN